MYDILCLCGKVGSGKTSYAYELESMGGHIVIGLDLLMQPLFGNSLARNEFDEKRDICIDYIYGIARQIAGKNDTIVFDLGYWTKTSRAYVLKTFRDFRVKFIYFKIDRDIQEQRIMRRNSLEYGTYIFTAKMIDELNGLFEEPDKSEGIDLEIIES